MVRGFSGLLTERFSLLIKAIRLEIRRMLEGKYCSIIYTNSCSGNQLRQRNNNGILLTH